MSSSPARRPDARDWTSLPPDMLNRISDKLLLLSNFIRFRSVCPSWRASAPASATPPQLPWLLIPYHNPDTSDLQLYSLSTKKIHNVPVSKANGKLLHGPAYHYFLAVDSKSGDNSLFNPLTGNGVTPPILLPKSVCTKPIPIYNREYLGSFSRFQSSAILAARQLNEVDCKSFRIACQSQGHTFYKGKYYMFDRKSLDLMTIDLTTCSVKSVAVLPPESTDSLSEEETMVDDWGDWAEEPVEDEHYEGFNYLIESSGELLRVSRSFNKFNVYHVDLDCENPRWVKKNSIGDAMLFLDSATGFSFRASDFPGFTGNCIYFMKLTDDCDLYNDFTLCRYKLEDGRTEVLTGSIKDYGTWFVPSLV